MGTLMIYIVWILSSEVFKGVIIKSLLRVYYSEISVFRIIIIKIINILVFKMEMDVTAEMTIRSSFQWHQTNVIILVLEMKMKFVVRHGDSRYTDLIKSSIYQRQRQPFHHQTRSQRP